MLVAHPITHRLCKVFILRMCNLTCTTTSPFAQKVVKPQPNGHGIIHTYLVVITHKTVYYHINQYNTEHTLPSGSWGIRSRACEEEEMVLYTLYNYKLHTLYNYKVSFNRYRLVGLILRLLQMAIFRLFVQVYNIFWLLLL